MTIRTAIPNDIDEIIRLCGDHAAFEQCEYESNGKAEQLSDDLFGPNCKLYCLIAEKEGKVVGYATYMKQYSTWDASEYLYMDCLYLDEESRGEGLGAKMIEEIQKFGHQHNIPLVQWQTPEFNTRAIKFYNRIGATSRSKERFFLS